MIDSSLLKHLSANQQNDLKALEDLFNSAGWKLVHAQFGEMSNSFGNRALNAENWGQFCRERGKAEIAALVTNLQTAVINEFEQIARDASGNTDEE